MNRLFFLSAPLASLLLAMGLDTIAEKETVQLEFEGTAQAMPACVLSEATAGTLGFDPAFPDQLNSRYAEGKAGSIEYRLSPDARARIFLTAHPEFLEAPAAADTLTYAFDPFLGGQPGTDASAEKQIAIPRGGAGELDIHLAVTTQNGISFPVGGPYLAQVIVTCEPLS